MSAPDASIVIAAFNAERTLPPLLAACVAQDYAGAVEVIVVDDGSPDGTRAVAEGFARDHAAVRVIPQENAGPAAARNRGWRAARAPVVLFTDSDCVPQRDWVRRLTTAFTEEGVDVAGGSYGIANRGHLLAEVVHAEIKWRHARMGRFVEFAGSFNFAARREALERVGGFDEAFPAPSGEDNDLCYRLRDAGYRIRFVPEALVDHHHPTDLGRYLREQSRHGFWRVFLYGTHPARIQGDGYAGPMDFLPPPLAVASVALLLSTPWWPDAAVFGVLSIVAILSTSSLLAMRVSATQRSSEALALAPIAALRAYARGWGMLKGFVSLLLRRKP